MRFGARIVGLLLLLCAWPTSNAYAQRDAEDPADSVCPRPAPGSIVAAPPELQSVAGTLELTLHLRTAFDRHRLQRFCYMADVAGGQQVQAPTLRVRQGDRLLLHFVNELSTDIHPQTAFPRAANPAAEGASGPTHDHDSMLATGGLPSAASRADAPCFALAMSATGSNLHFHGLDLAPVCHGDEVVRTLIRSGETFDYQLNIPATEPPGLYWYHPHVHGFSEAQVLGGASGALIVEPASVRQPVLPERLLILRDRLVTEATAKRHKDEQDLPVWDVSVNFVPVVYPANVPSVLPVIAGRRELWRVLNASADLTLDVELVADGVAQPFTVQAIDGIALQTSTTAQRTATVTHMLLPPGARAEAAVTMPPAGSEASLRTRAVDSGPDGENEPSRTLATLRIAPAAGDASGSRIAPQASQPAPAAASKPAVFHRKLYFSEHAEHPGDKESFTSFFLTVDGQLPHAYRMGQPADIRVHRGTVEEWTIENRARELHVFHIHQLHFKTVAIDGVATNDNTLRDTIAVPYWTGTGPYPSVRVRLDFSDPKIVGSFVYHCHILGHEDAGMMGAIDVLPEGLATKTVFETKLLPINASLAVRVLPAAPAGFLPVGTVQFQRGGCTLREVPLPPDGIATLAGPQGPSACPATGAVTAVYSGDTFFQGSSSTLGEPSASHPAHRTKGRP